MARGRERAALEGGAEDVAEDDDGGGGEACSHLLADKVIERGVGRDLGRLPAALSHHVHSCA